MCFLPQKERRWKMDRRETCGPFQCKDYGAPDHISLLAALAARQACRFCPLSLPLSVLSFICAYLLSSPSQFLILCVFPPQTHSLAPHSPRQVVQCHTFMPKTRRLSVRSLSLKHFCTHSLSLSLSLSLSRRWLLLVFAMHPVTPSS